MTLLQMVLGALSGTAIGFTLALVGGGGSILAVPLMVYLVGVKDPHVAIGTSALAVAANALIGLGNHARKRNVKWRCALTFAAAGVVGAAFGAERGRPIFDLADDAVRHIGLVGLELARRTRRFKG